MEDVNNSREEAYVSIRLVATGTSPDEGLCGVVESAPVALTREQQDLVSRHIGLVGVHLRTRVPTPAQPHRRREFEDLFQEGCVALMRAAARYNPDRDGAFAAYAIPRIRSAVHTAIHERFTVVHVPARALKEWRQTPGSRGHMPPQGQDWTADLEKKLADASNPVTAEESLRHTLRRRFERAVQRAMVDLRGRRWRQRNPCEIMARIAAERLLIGQEVHRTPLRQIARDFGVSSGRASAYEKQLTDTVAEYMRRDAQVTCLLELAWQDPDGLDGRMDADRRAALLRAEVAAFSQEFAELQPSARAEVLYRLIERSSHNLTEVAANLFRLTASVEDRPARTVA